jgi:phosphate transport system substrate-binding protein
MSGRLRRGTAAIVFAVLLAASTAVVVGSGARPAGAASAVNGSGSTYVALAMQQWVADAQTSGLSVNYTPTGSPDGLTSFQNSLTDFAGTEAEFSALTGGAGDISRGYQYVPDVAGAIAVMYNVSDKAGRKVDYLHLSRSTIAKIFMGYISNWDDPAITADNKGLVLPNEPITVVYRGGQSGTTALFYDFVQHTEPALFGQWVAKNQLPTTVRIIQLDGTPGFAPKTVALSGSDQIAQFTGSSPWTIAYDEFGYAKTYNVPVAWVQNASGAFVQPFAQNISAALESAALRPDLSQELAGVYASGNPLAYPISAYSYLVTQCSPAGDRPTCHGPYADSGVAQTLSKWMRYIACDGQVNMAAIGYSPLPPNLSQEITNSVARMTGGAAEQLNRGNCANPRFAGNLGAGATSPPDPLANVPSLAGSSGAAAASKSASSNAAASSASGATASGSASGRAGDPKSVGGGSTSYRKLHPVAYSRDKGANHSNSSTVVWVFLALVVVPPLVFGLVRYGRSRRRPGPA